MVRYTFVCVLTICSRTVRFRNFGSVGIVAQTLSVNREGWSHNSSEQHRYSWSAVWGVGFGARGVGLGVWGLRFGVQDLCLRFEDWGLCSLVRGLVFGTWVNVGFGIGGSGFREQDVLIKMDGLRIGVHGLGSGAHNNRLLRPPSPRPLPRSGWVLLVESQRALVPFVDVPIARGRGGHRESLKPLSIQ